MKTYLIIEDWYLPELEHYENEREGLVAVRRYIKNWYEVWKCPYCHNDYKIISFKTDYKTYAECKIRRDRHIDKFYLTVREK